MKLAAVVAVVAAVIVCCAAAVDWTAVSSKVGEIEAGIRQAAVQIKEAALQEKSDAGTKFASRIDAFGVKAHGILEQGVAAIKDQSLTEAKAKEFLLQVREEIRKLQTDEEATKEMKELPAASFKKIEETFGAAEKNVEGKAKELYEILNKQ